jgi:hypothetical protein
MNLKRRWTWNGSRIGNKREWNGRNKCRLRGRRRRR